MNAILHFPTSFADELLLMRGEVASHRHEIEASLIAWEQSQAIWISRESDITCRMNAVRQRLASLLA